jgi:hypothetical protein
MEMGILSSLFYSRLCLLFRLKGIFRKVLEEY